MLGQGNKYNLQDSSIQEAGLPTPGLIKSSYFKKLTKTAGKPQTGLFFLAFCPFSPQIINPSEKLIILKTWTVSSLVGSRLVTPLF